MSRDIETILLPSSFETGKLGVYHLKRYWAIAMGKRNGSIPHDQYTDEWNDDTTMLNMLGLGLEQTIIYLYREAPAFEDFEQWVLDINGGHIDTNRISGFNRIKQGEQLQVVANPFSGQQMITAEQQACWDENGYLIIPSVISRDDCDQTIELICRTIGITRDDPSTWYQAHPARQGIMVQLFQHPLLEQNRQNALVKKVYEELWGRTDLIVSTDRVGFNPPETESWVFPGPRMHWDVSLELPVPFGLQGILYLSDTAATQGAFSLVPGFHHHIEKWIHDLPPGAHPRQEDIYKLGVQPIAAGAGDFIIWHHALPHGSSANKSDKPRFVQYINWLPPDPERNTDWI